MNITESEGGVKFDQDKPRPELYSPQAILAVSKILAYGAKKYADRNWEKGIVYSRIYGALQRHLLAFWSGEDIDPESGLPHLSHAGCCMMFLLHYESDVEMLENLDDRP